MNTQTRSKSSATTFLRLAIKTHAKRLAAATETPAMTPALTCFLVVSGSEVVSDLRASVGLAVNRLSLQSHLTVFAWSIFHLPWMVLSLRFHAA